MAAMLGEERARGLTLVADYQQHGSGRKGRSWIAAPGTALLCTVALPDPLPSSNLWIVPFWSALVVRAALGEFGLKTQLQWPNDVLTGGRKIAGILCISRITGVSAWAASGIGVNVHRPKDDPEQPRIAPPPAYLSDYADADRDAVLDAVLSQAEATYDDLSSPQRIARAWETAAGIPGMVYRIALDGEKQPFEAEALRLMTGGALMVKHEGVERTIALADARILRE